MRLLSLLLLLLLPIGCTDALLQTSRVYDCRSGECKQVAEVKTNGYVEVTVDDFAAKADHKRSGGPMQAFTQALGTMMPVVVGGILAND